MTQNYLAIAISHIVTTLEPWDELQDQPWWDTHVICHYMYLFFGHCDKILTSNIRGISDFASSDKFDCKLKLNLPPKIPKFPAS